MASYAAYSPVNRYPPRRSGNYPSRTPPTRFQRVPLSRMTFDCARAVKFMGNVNTTPVESGLAEAMTKRNAQISPIYVAVNPDITDLTNALCVCLDEISIESKESQIREFHKVGSFKAETMLSYHTTADLVIVLETVPTRELITKLGDTLMEYLKKKEGKYNEVTQLEQAKNTLVFCLNAAVVRLMFCCTMTQTNIQALGADEPNKTLCTVACNAIKHTKWLENEANNGLRILVRLLKDIRNRFPTLSGLTSRMIDLLSVNSLRVVNDPISLPSAFRRAIQLMSSGVFMPGSFGVSDPLVPNYKATMNDLTYEQMDDICRTSQAILRLLYLGAYTEVLSQVPGADGVLFDKYPNVRLPDKVFVPPVVQQATADNGILKRALSEGSDDSSSEAAAKRRPDFSDDSTAIKDEQQ